MRQVTQNIDGLQPPSHDLIEAHGRIGLYKCVGNPENREDEEESEEGSSANDPNRAVHLGHRSIARDLRHSAADREVCPYQFLQSLDSDQLEPNNRYILTKNPKKTNTT